MALKTGTFARIQYVPPVLRKWTFEGDHFTLELEKVLVEYFEVSSLVMLCYTVICVAGSKSVLIITMSLKGNSYHVSSYRILVPKQNPKTPDSSSWAHVVPSYRLWWVWAKELYEYPNPFNIVKVFLMLFHMKKKSLD